MIVNKSHLQIEKDGRQYAFFCDQNCSLFDVVEVLTSMKDEISEIIKKHQEAQKELTDAAQ